MPNHPLRIISKSVCFPRDGTECFPEDLQKSTIQIKDLLSRLRASMCLGWLFFFFFQIKLFAIEPTLLDILKLSHVVE